MAEKKRWEVCVYLHPSIYRKNKRLAVQNDTTITSVVAQVLWEWIKWIRKAELIEQKNDEKAKKELGEIQRELDQEFASRIRSQ